MPDALHETDVLVWSERQAGLLRRLAAGERLNETVDWANVIDEVQDVGLSELRAVESLSVQAMIRLLKAYAWPEGPARRHWLNEVAVFLADARRRYSPSMRQRIGMGELFADAVQVLAMTTDDSGVARALPAACPWSLEELLDRELRVDRLLYRLEPDGAGR